MFAMPMPPEGAGSIIQTSVLGLNVCRLYTPHSLTLPIVRVVDHAVMDRPCIGGRPWSDGYLQWCFQIRKY